MRANIDFMKAIYPCEEEDPYEELIRLERGMILLILFGVIGIPIALFAVFG